MTLNAYPLDVPALLQVSVRGFRYLSLPMRNGKSAVARNTLLRVLAPCNTELKKGNLPVTLIFPNKVSGGNPGHFVTVESVSNGVVKYWDPDGGIIRSQSIDKFTDIATGAVFR
jgi:hypothetical protein